MVGNTNFCVVTKTGSEVKSPVPVTTMKGFPLLLERFHRTSCCVCSTGNEGKSPDVNIDGTEALPHLKKK